MAPLRNASFGGQLSATLTNDGRVLDCDFVVVGVGAQPNTELAEQVGIEHWANALHQGPVAARGMLGKVDAYDRIPYFFSDQYEAGMEYTGFATEWDRVAFRGDPASREFLAFWIADDRVVAGMNLNVWDVSDSIERLVRDRKMVDDRRLADPGIPIDELTSSTPNGT